MALWSEKTLKYSIRCTSIHRKDINSMQVYVWVVGVVCMYGCASRVTNWQCSNPESNQNDMRPSVQGLY